MRFGVATAVILAVTLIGLRVLFATALRQEFAGADLVYSMQPLLGGAPAAVRARASARGRVTPIAGASVLEDIRARRVLRVLVLPDRLPFAFQNREGRLVGMDVELAQPLAADLSGGRPVLSDRRERAGRAARHRRRRHRHVGRRGDTRPRHGHVVFHALPRRDAGVRDARSAARSLPHLGRHPPARSRPRRRARRSRIPRASLPRALPRWSSSPCARPTSS